MSIGSGNGLAPNRRQTIIWTNADSVHWRIYAGLGGDELLLGDQFWYYDAIFIIWEIPKYGHDMNISLYQQMRIPIVGYIVTLSSVLI